MKIEEFRQLTEEEKVQKINERLLQLNREKKGVNLFKCDDLEFSYQTATRIMQDLEYAKDGIEFKKEFKLNEKEILMLKNLAQNYEFMMKEKVDKPEVIRRPADRVNTTSVRMYNDVWSRWQLFCKEWSIYNGLDLMASALEEYMDKHDFPDLETLKNK